MEKIAKLWADSVCSPGPCGCTKTWADQFQGTPLYKRALAVQKDDAALDVKRAKQRAEQDRLYAEESAARVQVSEIEAELAEWKYKNMGIEPSKTAEALEGARGGQNAPATPMGKFASAPEEESAEESALRDFVIEKLAALRLQ